MLGGGLCGVINNETLIGIWVLWILTMTVTMTMTMTITITITMTIAI